MSSFAVVLRNVADTLPVRGSMRSRGAAAISTVTLRQVSAVLPPERAWGLWASRQIVAGVMDTFGPSLRERRSSTSTCGCPTAAGSSANGFSQRASRRGNRAIYYVHGSGYALCSPRTHRRLTSWLSALTGLPVFVVDYRLAPRHRFPTRRNGCAGRMGLADSTSTAWPRSGWSSQVTRRAAISPSTCCCNPTSTIRPRWC